ncbi:FAD/NAD(P)-binding protein [Glarea lozoyensis ATCC 20868]|uniref:FAD/NAD(P)-binding protein n=1 Tax=Glarea lozoyensis (strain ATCC 20868 / MF5171) TaxID=1116229 RepID=S3CZX0_GLAL2|nr:FAD/NAD(P)-binding protein [Glarea lozoyensis ATCC 20868]EPE30449.1 FAD/NAD(P)-binding protein [Glarea lozoyensis ATCC 20868]
MAQEYKLKGLTSLDLKAGEKREVEVEGIEEGKVLLCNVGGKTSAIGARCTHYGAPLVKGVLTGDGRLTCPWHGACFKASNGDIENAPAIDALPSFELSEKSGGVYVTGEESAIKNSRRKPKLRVNGKAPEKVVVVGGGSGALGAIEALREGGFTGGITMISSEGHTPYDRTKLSKALIDDHSKIALRDEDWFKDASVDVVYDQVTDIVFDGKKVATKSGNSFSYTKLILATGGSPKNLPLPGFKDLGNIFLLRTIPHVKEIVSAIGSKNKKIVVIGSSFIGMEVANATSKDNTVTVVGMESAPLERVMGAEVGKIFQSQLSKSGITFKLSAGVEKAIPSSTDSSNVGGVVLKDGTTLEADLVILGIGVSPQTSYLQDNDAVQLEKDGSLKTNEHFQLDGHKDVYAIGDIATYPYHGPGGNGTPTRIEHWNVAQNAGRAAANHILHPDSDPKLFTPIFWSALGSQLRYCGATPNGWDTLTLKGEPNEGKFAAYYSKGDTVVAVATMGMDPIMSQASELMRRGVMPSKGEIEGGVDILGIDVPAL